MMMRLIRMVLYYTLRMIGGYLIVVSILASIVASYQESKIWKKQTKTTKENDNQQQQQILIEPLALIGYIKVFLFNLMWMVGCFIGSSIILIKYCITFGHVDMAYECHHYVEHHVSVLLMECLIGTVQIIGIEHLPSKGNAIPAPVYIANHASQLDISSVYYIKRRFKWIAKQSVLYLPGVGQLMYLAKHVFIHRSGKHKKDSTRHLFEASNEAIQHGIPMFIFPQGTRIIQKQLPFKNGAFTIAQTNHSTLIPISIQIPLSPSTTTGSSSSNGDEPIVYKNPWNTLYPLMFTGENKPITHLTIHPPIPVTGQENMDLLKEQCRKLIYSVLPNFHNNHIVTIAELSSMGKAKIQ